MRDLLRGKLIFTAVVTFCIGVSFVAFFQSEDEPHFGGDPSPARMGRRIDCTFFDADSADGRLAEKLAIWRELDAVHNKLKKHMTLKERAELELREARLRAQLRLFEREDEHGTDRYGLADGGTTKLVYREVCLEN